MGLFRFRGPRNAIPWFPRSIYTDWCAGSTNFLVNFGKRRSVVRAYVDVFRILAFGSSAGKELFTRFISNFFRILPAAVHVVCLCFGASLKRIMKFKFCGDLDSPDWVLAGISALSSISSVKVKALANAVMSGMLDGSLDILKLKKILPASKMPDELPASFSHDEGEIDPTMSLCCSVIEFIFHSSAKNAVDSSVLTDELQQLGLPKEHATGLSKIHSARGQTLHDLGKHRSLRVNTLSKLEWRIDFPSSVMTGNHSPTSRGEVEAKAVTCLSILDHSCGAARRHLVALNKAQLKALVADLKDVSSVLEKLS